jgi:predicted metal-dependent peptidase
MTLSNAVRNKIYNRLNARNPIFGAMWKRGGLVFSTEYDTAALEIADGKFRISFNPTYWKKITPYNRLFIICHEYLHVVLGHWLNPVVKVDSEWLNIAQDIQVNEMLANDFGFVRSKIKNWKDQAWIDTVFKNKSYLVKHEEDAEYYYDLLIRCVTPVCPG